MKTTITAVTGAIVITASLLTGCSSTSSTSPSRSSQPQATSPQPSARATTTVSEQVTSPPARATTPVATATGRSTTPVATVPALADGRYAARITAVDSPRRQVTVDVVQLFLGKAAAAAAAADHAAEVPPPNDVWIRNQSRLLRTLHVAPTAPITVNVLSAEITHSAVKDLPVTLTRLHAFPHLDSGVFWLTVRHGVVTRIAEQYLP
jgi:hypothetical protein